MTIVVLFLKNDLNLFQPFKTTISHFYFIAVMNKKKNKNSKLAKLYFTVKKSGIENGVTSFKTRWFFYFIS